MKGVMVQNIEKVTQRGEKLEDLGERAGQNTHSQSLFHSVGVLHTYIWCISIYVLWMYVMLYVYV